MTTHSRQASVPEVIQRKLSELLSRFRHILFMKGLGLTLGVFLAAMLAAIAVDRLFIIAMSVRVLMTAVALGLTALTAGVFWIRPWLRKVDRVTLAAAVEREHPELEERVSTTIELLTGDERPEFRGSEEMIEAVAEQAEESSKPVDFRGAVSSDRARTSTMFAAFLMLVTVSVAVLWWGPFTQLMARFMMPWANIARVSSTTITVQDPTDKLVVMGDPVQVVATVAPASVKEAWLWVEVKPGQWEKVRMIGERGTFSHRITDVDRDMRYYIRAGDGITQRYDIRVVEPPRLARLDVRYDYPEYTKVPPRVRTGFNGEIRVLKGTRVTLTAIATKNVRKATLFFDETSRPVPMTETGDGSFEGAFTVTRSDYYKPEFEDEHGFTNAREGRLALIATDDNAPEVTILEPERNIKVHEKMRLPMTVELRDDFGVMSMGIEYRVNEGKTVEVGVPFAHVGEARFATDHRWDLGQVEAKPGDTIAYRVKAIDNLPGPRPNTGYSHWQHILISFPKYDQDRNLRQEQLRRVKQQLAKLKEQLQEAERQTRAMKKLATDKKPVAEEQGRFKDRVEKNLEASEKLAQDLTKMLEKDPLLDALKPKAEEVEKENIPKAQEAAKKIDELKPMARSEEPIEETDHEIKEALRKVDEMAKEITELEKLEEEERKLAEMARKEEELARRAEDLKPDQKNQSDELANEQDRLHDLVQPLMDEDMKKDALQENIGDLEDAMDKAKELAEREKDLKGRTDELMKKKMEEIARRQEELNKKAEAAKPDVQPKLDERKAGEVPEKAMAKALEEIKAQKPVEALAEQRKAEDEMRKQADALDKPAPKQEGQPEKPAATEQAKKMNELAEEQKKIREDLARLAGLERQEKLADLQKKQEELKKEAQALNEQAQPQTDKEQPRGEKAPEEMERALDELKKETPREALPHQEQAARELDDMAKNLEKQAEAKKPPEAQAEKKNAEKAAELAQRQRELKEELDEAFPEPPKDMQRLAQEQEDIEQDARELEDAVEEAAAALAEAMPQAAEQSKKVRQAMKKAPEHMDNAEHKLEAGEAEPASGEEQKAIDALEQAAAEMGKLAEMGEQALAQMQGQADEAGSEVAKALGLMKNASQELRGNQPQKGQQSMEEAARHLAQAAQQKMGNRPGRPQQARDLDSRFGVRGLGKVQDPDQLKLLKLTSEEWNRLPGEMKEQLLQALNEKYPDEYRDLIRDYFKKLAETGVPMRDKETP